MLTPTFTIEQDNDFIIINIKVPYVKISSSEFHIEQFQFKYFLHPYLLNLTFQQPLKEAEEPHSASYDHETYILQVKLKKQQKGEFFEDLQMLTKLINKPEKILQNKSKNNNKSPMIQVLNESSNYQETNSSNDQQESLEKLNLNTKFQYGFNNQYQQYFQDLTEEIEEIGELNPDNVSIQDRKQIRDKIIQEKFDDEHYLFDFFDNEEEINEKMYLKLQITQQISQEQQQESKKLYTEQEWDTLIKLPNKQYILNEKSEIFLQIADIAFAYLYELRSFDDELTCESPLTINKLSSTLSCFTINENIKEVLAHSFKRALTYPLYRNFALCQKVQQDLAELLCQGKLNILKLFINIKNIFDTSEPRYLLNRLFIEDFLVIIQQFQNEEFQDLGKQVKQIKLSKKNDFKDLDLYNLEKSAEIVMDRDYDKPPTEQQIQEAQQLQQQPQVISEQEKKQELEKQQKEEEEFQQKQQLQQQNNKKVLIEDITDQNQQQQQPNKVLIEDITEQMENTQLEELE